MALKRHSRFEGLPIIIGGCGRSGTSLLLSILSAHPSIFAIPDETNAFCPTAYTRNTDLNAPLELDRIRQILSTSQVPNKATRWCEKTPKNIIFFRKILQIFGRDIQLINIVRDGRDVITSRHPSNPDRSRVGLERWIQDVNAGVAFDTHPQVLVVKYESLVLNFRETVERICEFLREPVNARILEWHTYATVRRHSAWPSTLKAMHSQSIGRWRLPEYSDLVAEMMADVDAIRLLKHYGYLPASTKPVGAWKPRVVARWLNRRIPAGVKSRMPASLKLPVKRHLRLGDQGNANSEKRTCCRYDKQRRESDCT